MKLIFYSLLAISLFACKKIGPKHCYECTTLRSVAGQIRTIDQCGTSAEIEDFEKKGYKYTIHRADGSESVEIIPLACVQKD
jgi:hypothetical protein